MTQRSDLRRSGLGAIVCYWKLGQTYEFEAQWPEKPSETIRLSTERFSIDWL